MDVSMQKRLAADILKVGISRVRIKPEELERVADAITRDDVKILIDEGAIYAVKKKGISKRERRKRKGPGSRKGKKGARAGKKELWVKKVRKLRWVLKVMKDRGEIDTKTYRKLRLWIKGGQIRSVRHLKEVLRKMEVVE